jgi:hypothetical protein
LQLTQLPAAGVLLLFTQERDQCWFTVKTWYYFIAPGKQSHVSLIQVTQNKRNNTSRNNSTNTVGEVPAEQVLQVGHDHACRHHIL